MNHTEMKSIVALLLLLILAFHSYGYTFPHSPSSSSISSKNNWKIKVHHNAVAYTFNSNCFSEVIAHKLTRMYSVPTAVEVDNSNNDHNGDNKVGDVGFIRKAWHYTRFMEDFFKGCLSFLFKDPDILRISSKILSSIFWVYIALSTLGTIGFDTKPILSLLSISGLTFGLASKDILTNTFAGLFVLITRPFKRGDIVTVGNFKGKVVSIDIRYCKIEGLNEKTLYLLPSSMIYSNVISIEKSSM